MRVTLFALCGAIVLSAAHGAAIRPVIPLQLAFEPAESGAGFVARASGYDVALSGNGRRPGVVNYLVGNDARHWRRGVPTYAEVRGSGLYPGVDIVFDSGEGRLEYDFIFAPRADASCIAMRFSGARKVVIDEQGDLIANDVRPANARWLSPFRATTGGGRW